MRSAWLSVAAAVAFATTAACGGGEGSAPSSPTFEPKLSVIEEEIFSKSCTFSACHSELTPREGLSLAGSTFARLVNVPSKQATGRVLVRPGDPEGSYLIEKLTQLAPTLGVRMPEGQPGLDPGRIQAIVTWIQEGALEN